MFTLIARVVFVHVCPILGTENDVARLTLRVGRLISMTMGASPDEGAASGAAETMCSNAVSLVNLIVLHRTSTLGAEQHQRPNDLIFRLYTTITPLVFASFRM
jgi:hypothetical protein